MQVNVVSAGAGRCLCELKVDQEHTNRMGNLHGGLTAALVDTVSTVAVMTTGNNVPGVSVELSVS